MYDDYDVPSKSDAAADAAADRADEARRLRDEAAARARGEYVPSWQMRMIATTLTFYAPTRPVSVRDGVFWLPGATAAHAEELTGRYGTRFEPRVVDDGVWVRTDPTLERPPYDAGPAPAGPDMFWAQDVADQATRHDTRRTA